MWTLFWFPVCYDCRSMAVLSDRIARAFNRSGATQGGCNIRYIQGFLHGLAHHSSSQTQVSISDWFFVLALSF